MVVLLISWQCSAISTIHSYYYDTETGFYYLQSRYYDPVIHRFINADTYTTTDKTDAISCNMFAYCGNNPVNRIDPTGEDWWHWAVAAVAVGLLVAASIATCGGAAAAAGAAAAIVTGTCTTVSAGATIVTGAAVGAGIAFAGSAVTAATTSNSLDEFAGQGKNALINTGIWAVGGAAMGTLNTAFACFVEGTLVCSEYGAIPIEEIQAEDYVWSWDEETGDVALKQVVETYINETMELTHIFVDGEEIVCTPSHPFYAPQKGWTNACKLRAGDILVLVNGEYVVVEKVQHELLESPVKVYNFQVEDYHTYYVTNIGVLVHNSCDYNAENSSGTGRAPKQGNSGTTYTQISSDGRGQVVSQTTYNSYNMPGQRIDYIGRSHNGIPTPHVHTFDYKNIGGIVRRIKEYVTSL